MGKTPIARAALFGAAFFISAALEAVPPSRTSPSAQAVNLPALFGVDWP